jgi:Cu+-exporting ATPase
MTDSGVAISPAIEDYLQENEQRARTAVIVAFDGTVAGVIGVSDPLKQEAAVVVEGLKSMGIKCIMVTGDNWQTARSVADEVWHFLLVPV